MATLRSWPSRHIDPVADPQQAAVSGVWIGRPGDAGPAQGNQDGSRRHLDCRMWPRLKRRRCLLEYSMRVGQNFQRLLSVKLIYSRERS